MVEGQQRFFRVVVEDDSAAGALREALELVDVLRGNQQDAVFARATHHGSPELELQAVHPASVIGLLGQIAPVVGELGCFG